MGFLSSLLMAYGKRRLFAGKTAAAARAFARAAASSPEDPLPLAYHSWAVGASDKDRAVADAARAVALDPGCAEAHMSLALAHATGAADFEQASLTLGAGRALAPRDADGAVLSIGVYLLFVDALASMKEDGQGFSYDFKATPLRAAAEALLRGRAPDAFAEFRKMYLAGREAAGGLGLAAAGWVKRDHEAARTFAKLLADSGEIQEPGLLAAVRLIDDASR